MTKRGTVSALLVVAGFAGCGGERSEGAGAGGQPKVSEAGPIHVHGLGINPEDGALFIATHTGLFRAAEGRRKAVRVGDRFQDTMSFTVVGPDHFLGSGHPDGRENLPPFLGLIESRDAGKSWKPVSLQGERDFHVLEARGRRVYGYGSDYETRRASLLVSDDGGRRWEQRHPPEPLVSLAMDPGDDRRLIASGENALHLSTDAGRRWRRLGGQPGLVVWPASDRLYTATAGGALLASADQGRRWRRVGDAGGQPAALEAAGRSDLYLALHDGTVKRSTDGGASWSVRSKP